MGYTWFGGLLLLLLACVLVAWAWHYPLLLLSVFVVVAAASVDGQRQQKAVQTKLSRERKGLSICDFARSLDYRRVDTWVIRAVYEKIQDYVSSPNFLVPIRKEDDLIKVLDIDEEDLELDLLPEILWCTGRSEENTSHNPWYGKIVTVEDLVQFVNAQPRIHTP